MLGREARARRDASVSAGRERDRDVRVDHRLPSSRDGRRARRVQVEAGRVHRAARRHRGFGSEALDAEGLRLALARTFYRNTGRCNGTERGGTLTSGLFATVTAAADAALTALFIGAGGGEGSFSVAFFPSKGVLLGVAVATIARCWKRESQSRPAGRVRKYMSSRSATRPYHRSPAATGLRASCCCDATCGACRQVHRIIRLSLAVVAEQLQHGRDNPRRPPE